MFIKSESALNTASLCKSNTMTNIIIFLLHIKEFGVFQINWQRFIDDALKDIYSNNETVLYISFVSYPLWNWKHAKNLNLFIISNIISFITQPPHYIIGNFFTDIPTQIHIIYWIVPAICIQVQPVHIVAVYLII